MAGKRFILMAMLVGIAGCGLCGCAAKQSSSQQFNTVARDNRRETEVARKLAAQGADLIDKGKWPEAEAALQKAIDADVTYGPAHNNMGTVYLHQNNLYQAAWEFQYAAKLMPEQPEPRNNLGLVFETGGKFDEAIDSYDQALKVQPENPQYLGNDARARVRRGDKDAKLREMLTKLASLDTRPDWLEWAREKLALMGTPATSQPSEVP